MSDDDIRQQVWAVRKRLGLGLLLIYSILFVGLAGGSYIEHHHRLLAYSIYAACLFVLLSTLGYLVRKGKI